VKQLQIKDLSFATSNYGRCATVLPIFLKFSVFGTRAALIAFDSYRRERGRLFNIDGVNSTWRRNMKSILMGAIVASAAFVAPAMAWEGQKVACYDKHWVPATYSTEKYLEYPSKKKWEHKDGQMVKMYYPPIYMEKRTMSKPGHYVLRKAPCN